MKNEKGFRESFREVREEQCEMLIFGQLVLSYGGWQWGAAVEGAKTHAAKAARMGGSWVNRDPISGLTVFMKLRHMHREVLESKWLSSRTSSRGRRTRSRRAAASTDRRTAKTPSPSPTKKAIEPRSQQGGKPVDGQTVASLLKGIKKCKDTISTALSRSEDFSARVKSPESSYDWANTNKHLSKLERMREEFSNRLTSQDWEFIVCDGKTVKENTHGGKTQGSSRKCLWRSSSRRMT
eukprot:NODE_12787_length_1204_cov_3.680594.p1 GENE.NODE_12787_length_1204_cov_3.680594~~NODE_12787_length_1204_cov_3.680594.p1  ORF type:complete len:238 (+),score=33.64 NODE_12787_length_1204_cov_3.680594:339-1052(+)